MIPRRPRFPLPALALAFALAAGGCGKQTVTAPNPGPDRFPTGVELIEGDVILGRSFGMVGTLFALHGAEPGPYSHGAMYFVDGDGCPRIANFRPNGMEVTTPEDFFTRYLRLALVRYNGAYEPSELSRAAECWIEQNRQKRIRPDYRLDRDDWTTMYCIEFTGHIYRSAGLPDPFERMLPMKDSPLLARASTMFNFESVEAVPSPNVLLTRDDFTVVATWEWDGYDLRREAINETLAAVAGDTIVEGWTPRPASWGERLKVRQGLVLLKVAGGIMFWRPSEPLPDYVRREHLYRGYVMFKHIAAAKKQALATLLATPFPPADDAEARATDLARVRAATRAIAEELRPRYYCPPAPDAEIARKE